MRIFWSILAMALCLGMGIAYFTSSQDSAVIEVEPLPVAVFPVHYQETYQQRRLYSGRVLPAQRTDLAFRIGGRIDRVTVDVGDRVGRGDVLARVDTSPFLTATRALEAQLHEAQAEATRATRFFDRTKTLEARGFATTQEVDNALAGRDASLQRVESLARQVEAAQEDLADASLLAPFDGTIVERYVDEGTVIDAGRPIVRVSGEGRLEAEIDLPSAQASRLFRGQDLVLVHDGVPLDGTVTGISRDIDPLTRSQTVRIGLQDHMGLLPGALVRLELFETRAARGFWVPLGALQESYRGLWSLYAVDRKGEGAEGRIARYDVEILSITEDRAYVTGTPTDGQSIVSDAPFRFVPGQSVKIVREETAPTRPTLLSGLADRGLRRP
ncbi:efflux RND transporter periplasmic adaptor subunit [Parvularcula bermudensis]|nr:efflux RND transporter periplasmic adaptor subunit [Parvularcula bermudensis]